MKKAKAASLLILGIGAAFIASELFFLLLPYFWKIETKIHPDNKNFYIYIIGESTAFGEPYAPKIDFPKIVQYKFDGKISNRPLVLINLAKEGAKLHTQYWELFKELCLRPKTNSLLFVYAGINDRDMPAWEESRFLKKAYEHSVLFSKLAYFCKFWNEANYELALTRVMRLAHRYGIQVFVSNLVGNFTQYAPPDNFFFESKSRKQAFENALRLENSGQLKEAENALNNLIAVNREINPALIYYSLGRLNRKMGDFDSAKKYYYRASNDSNLFTPTGFQNEVIKKAVLVNNEVFVDTLGAFEKNADHGLIGYELCGDAHHPNLKGYLLVAECFADAIENKYGQKPAREHVTEEEILRHFDFNDRDMFNVFIHNVKWLLAAATQTGYRRENIEKAQEYLEKAKTNSTMYPENRKNKELNLVSLMISAIRHDVNGVLYWLEKGEFLNKNRGMIVTENDFYTSWLHGMLFEMDLPQEIKKQVNPDFSKHETKKHNLENLII